MLELLGKAWVFVKRSGIKTDGQSLAIYRHQGIDAGARLVERFEDVEGISCVATPTGLAATAVHMGPYERLGGAHTAIRDWCRANGREIEGVNWEVYGHWDADPARQRTDVFYLLRG